MSPRRTASALRTALHTVLVGRGLAMPVVVLQHIPPWRVLRQVHR